MSDSNTFEYKVKTSADLAGVKQTIDQQGKLIDTLRAAGKDTSGLEQNQKRLNQEFGQKYLELYKRHLEEMIEKARAAGQPIGELVNQLHNLKEANKSPEAHGMFEKVGESIHEALNEIPGIGALTRAMDGSLSIVAGVAAAFEAASKSLEEFAAAEVKVTELDAALAAQGRLTDEYREKLQGLAQEMSETTARADEEWLGVLATLTKFGASSENIEEVTEATKNLAGFLGGDLQSAAFLMGKALQGNFAMLGRYGIHVDEAATQTEKLEQVFQQLAQRGGGQLEARARTLSGQWATLTIAVADFFKGIGNVISRTSVLQISLYGLGKSIQWVNSHLPETIKQVEGLKNKSPVVITALSQIEDRFRDTGKAASAMGSDIKEAIGAKVDITGLTKDLDALTEKYKKSAEEAERLRKANDELRDAKAASEIAKVDLLEAKGKANKEGGITPEEARARRLAIRSKAESEKLNDDEKAQKDAAARAQNLINVAKAAERKTAQEAEEARKQADDANERVRKKKIISPHDTPEHALTGYEERLKEIEKQQKWNDTAYGADEKTELIARIGLLKQAVAAREKYDSYFKKEGLLPAAITNREGVEGVQQPVIDTAKSKLDVIALEREKLGLTNEKENTEIEQALLEAARKQQERFRQAVHAAEIKAIKEAIEKTQNDIAETALSGGNVDALKKLLINQQAKLQAVETEGPLSHEQKRSYKIKEMGIDKEGDGEAGQHPTSPQAADRALKQSQAAVAGINAPEGTVSATALASVKAAEQHFQQVGANADSYRQLAEAHEKFAETVTAKLTQHDEANKQTARKFENLALQLKNNTR